MYDVPVGPSAAEESEVEKEWLRQRQDRGQVVADIFGICSEAPMFRLRSDTRWWSKLKLILEFYIAAAQQS